MSPIGERGIVAKVLMLKVGVCSVTVFNMFTRLSLIAFSGSSSACINSRMARMSSSVTFNPPEGVIEGSVSMT